MKTIAFMNYKGGVGKTTLTANVGAALAGKGKKVLCIDIDPQANLSMSFFTVSEFIDYEASDNTINRWYTSLTRPSSSLQLDSLIIEPTKVQKQIQKKNRKGKLDLIISNRKLNTVDTELDRLLNLPEGSNTNYLILFSDFKRATASLENLYDYILVDCPPNMNVSTRIALLGCDYYVIPAKADALSTMGLNQLYKQVSDYTAIYNQRAEQYNQINGITFPRLYPQLLGVIFNMIKFWRKHPVSNMKTFIAKVAALGRTLQVVNAQPIILEPLIKNVDSDFGEIPESGIPAILHARMDSTFRGEINDVTNEIMYRVGDPQLRNRNYSN